jgi:MoxR-like ATPase
LCDYILSLVRATREHPALSLGASPRGSLGLLRIGQAMAAIQGNDSVSTDLIKELAEAALAHRLIVKPEPDGRFLDGREIIRKILAGGKPE